MRENLIAWFKPTPFIGTYSETVRLRPYWQLTPDTHWIWYIGHHWALGRFAAVFTDGPVVDRLNLGENLSMKLGSETNWLARCPPESDAADMVVSTSGATQYTVPVHLPILVHTKYSNLLSDPSTESCLDLYPTARWVSKRVSWKKKGRAVHQVGNTNKI